MAKFELGESVNRVGEEKSYQVAEALKLAGGQHVYRLHGNDELHLEGDLEAHIPPRFVVQKSRFHGARLVDTSNRAWVFTENEAETLATILNQRG